MVVLLEKFKQSGTEHSELINNLVHLLIDLWYYSQIYNIHIYIYIKDDDEGSSKPMNLCSIYSSEDMFQQGSLVIFNSNN